MYQLLFDKKFVKNYRKIGKSLQIEGDKKLKRLKENPEIMGKPLKFFHNLYELYLQMYRIYYAIDEAKKKILVLDIEHIDEQEKYLRQLTSEKIKQLLEENL